MEFWPPRNNLVLQHVLWFLVGLKVTKKNVGNQAKSQFSSRSVSAVSFLRLRMGNFLSDREDKRILNGEMGGNRPSIPIITYKWHSVCVVRTCPLVPRYWCCAFLVSSTVVENWDISFIVTRWSLLSVFVAVVVFFVGNNEDLKLKMITEDNWVNCMRLKRLLMKRRASIVFYFNLHPAFHAGALQKATIDMVGARSCSSFSSCPKQLHV